MPKTQKLQTTTTNPTTNLHSTAIATITNSTHNSANQNPHHPKPNQKLNKPTSKPPIKPSTTTNHKPMLEIIDPKLERAYFFEISHPKSNHKTQPNPATLAEPPQPRHLEQQRPTNHKLNLIFFTSFVEPLSTLVARVKL